MQLDDPGLSAVTPRETSSPFVRVSTVLPLCVLTLSGGFSSGGEITVHEWPVATHPLVTHYDPAITYASDGLNFIYTATDLDYADLFRTNTYGLVFPVATGIGGQEKVRADGPRIAYIDNATGNGNVRVRDLDTDTWWGTPTPVTWEKEVDLSGDFVVYSSNRNGNEDIYYYYLMIGQETRLTTFPGADRWPSIHGNLVVWHRVEGGSFNLYGAYVGGAEFPIDTSPGVQRFPSVWGNLVAYNSDNDVWVCDVTSGTKWPITSDPYSVSSRVLIEGQYVFWSDNRNGNFDIFVHDLSEGLSYQMTTNVANQYLSDVDGENVVFTDTRSYDKWDVWRLEFEINHAPTADAGGAQNAWVGMTVQLSGSGLDPDLDPIVDWQWQILEKPPGSNTQLSDSMVPDPTMLIDVAGEYRLSLTVGDGRLWSEPTTMRVRALGRLPIRRP